MKPREIKTYSFEGVAQDQESIIRIRIELEQRMIEKMRQEGCIPVLDITPELYWEYQEDETFKFLLVMYGTEVGQDKSNQIMGMLGTHPIMFEPYEEKIELDDEVG